MQGRECCQEEPGGDGGTAGNDASISWLSGDGWGEEEGGKVRREYFLLARAVSHRKPRIFEEEEAEFLVSGQKCAAEPGGLWPECCQPLHGFHSLPVLES
jgi:hypothetical protein